MSGFSILEILRTAEGLGAETIWNIVIVQWDVLQVLLSMVVLFHSNQSTAEEDPGVWAKFEIALYPQWTHWHHHRKPSWLHQLFVNNEQICMIIFLSRRAC